jgi:hypothetical protein
MRFVVERTSQHFNVSIPPCEGAERGTYTYRDQIRTKYKPADWEARGTNHTENKSMCYREMERECWYIEIATLDDLMKFTKKYGDVIVGDAWMATKTPCIEIYDGYRE